MSELSILHLSDLHRDPANPIGNQPLIESIIRDYQKYTKEESPAVRPPDIVVVSGDIIYGIRPDTNDPEGELARQYDLLAPLAQDLAELRLRAAAPAVHIGGIEERDAAVEGLVDDGAGGFQVQLGAEVVAAEPDQRDPKARGPEMAIQLNFAHLPYTFQVSLYFQANRELYYSIYEIR